MSEQSPNDLCHDDGNVEHYGNHQPLLAAGVPALRGAHVINGTPESQPGRRSVVQPDGDQLPMAWTPPSTWMISPVVLGNQSESSATIARAAGSASLTSQVIGARASQIAASSSKPGIPLAAIVLIGPAETRLTRMFCLPRSRAR